MTERPILFSAPMVRAILSGSKSQTRRVVKPTPEWIEKSGVLSLKGRVGLPHVLCPYGQPGSRLWVRETWQHLDNVGQRAHEFLPHQKHSRHCFFLADESDPTTKPLSGRWRPSIHMPRWASRITLEITGVRVERLQDISEADAMAEGVSSVRSLAWDRQHFPLWRFEFDEAVAAGCKPPVGPQPSEHYRALWESINGPGSWDANPWVWCVSFRRNHAS